MEIVKYSDKSFVVFGEETKKHSSDLKTLGGRFNRYLKEKDGFEGGPGWIFSNSSKDRVENYLTTLKETEFNEGEIPFFVAPETKTNVYQNVKYRVFVPREGMKVRIKYGDKDLEGSVDQTLTHNNVVDTVYVNVDGKTTQLVICNGEWQVRGFAYDHKVFFD